MRVRPPKYNSRTAEPGRVNPLHTRDGKKKKNVSRCRRVVGCQLPKSDRETRHREMLKDTMRIVM